MKIIKINSVTKFSILDIGVKIKKGNNNINLSRIFWSFIFSKSFLQKFFDIYEKQHYRNIKNYSYINYKKKTNFIINKINLVINKINFINNEKVPGADDIFVSYKVFNFILDFLNIFYDKDKLNISLRDGIFFKNKVNNINDLLKSIKEYRKTIFFEKIIFKLLINNLNIKKIENEKIIFKFDIFWPGEFLFVGIISDFLKKKYKNVKIILDLSYGNEQFDFTQWINLIKKANKDFFSYYDFILVYKDFGNGIENIKKYIKGDINKKELKNVIFYDNGIIFNDLGEQISIDIFNEYIKNTFDKNKISKIFLKKSFYARFLPYKCYWSKCNFCAINSNNKFSYDKKYSYHFFINKWIEFIKENDIKAINFKDEAIPPTVIIKFAKKLIENHLEVNFQFRTRFEKLYTYQNCKILKKAGCGYCGIGLESAVDRVNEEIGNKGNIGITIKDKLRIIHNFDKARISFHNYSIIGFPGETDIEAGITYKFLKYNILHSNYYTCTPNIFGLMKGPRIFSEKEKFGIEINTKDLKDDFKLVYDFTYKGQKRNLKLLKFFENDLHNIQFLPWLNNSIDGRKFWDYIDRSYIFYLMKRYHSTSPYYVYKNINNNLNFENFERLLGKYFILSNYINLYKSECYNWVECKYILNLDKNFINFLEKYNNNLKLGENIRRFFINIFDINNKNLLLILIKERFLIIDNTHENKKI